MLHNTVKKVLSYVEPPCYKPLCIISKPNPTIFLFFAKKYASSKLLLIISEQILRKSILSIVTTSSKLLCTVSPYHAEGQNAYFETFIYIIQDKYCIYDMPTAFGF